MFFKELSQKGKDYILFLKQEERPFVLEEERKKLLRLEERKKLLEKIVKGNK